jgi:hypothetical protein
MTTAPHQPMPAESIPHLIEQYKVYLADLGNIGGRQAQTNVWHVTIVSALVVFMGYIAQHTVLKSFDYAAIAAAAFVGIILCVLWLFRAQSYKILYDAKFTVLGEREAAGPLPFNYYSREKEIIGSKRRRFGTLDQSLSAALALPFVAALIFAIVKLL